MIPICPGPDPFYMNFKIILGILVHIYSTEANAKKGRGSLEERAVRRCSLLHGSRSRGPPGVLGALTYCDNTLENIWRISYRLCIHVFDIL